MYCSSCGASYESDVSFCAACGAPMQAAAATPVSRVRPGVVTLLAVLEFLTGFAWLFIALLCVTLAASEDKAIGVALAVFFFVLGSFALICGHGLWTLRPYGRYLQMAYSFIGLLGFPFQTVISILILLYVFKPGVALLFSGKPPETFTPAEQAHVRSLQSSVAALVIAVVAAVLMGTAMMGIIAAIAIPNFLNAVDRGRQKRSMADLRSIGVAVESYAVDHNAYPAAASPAELKALLEPKYIKAMPMTDGWGKEFDVGASATGYTLLSHGKDGIGSNCEAGVTVRFNEEICFANGQFVRFPQGMQP